MGSKLFLLLGPSNFFIAITHAGSAGAPSGINRPHRKSWLPTTSASGLLNSV